MRLSWLGWLALALPLLGCPKEGETGTSGQVRSACYRDVSGDLQTIRKRLEKGRPMEARLYVEGLADCPEALGSIEYHQLDSGIAEELGDLNGAWAATLRGLLLAADSADDEAKAVFQSVIDRFHADYVWLAKGESAEPPLIRYAGAVVDDETLRQLEDVANGKSVRSESGEHGYWVYPGRYRINGAMVALSAGQSHRLDAVPGGSP
jgi:hypothetical protein